MKEKTSVWDTLPHWQHWVSNNKITEDNGDVRNALRMMCDCMQRSRIRSDRGDVYKLLSAWYMPRNENDVRYFMRRYAILCRLPQCVNEIINAKDDRS